jgi:peptidoglycan/xylan/chitin deacetylase (PgdA/CDA1 family)
MARLKQTVRRVIARSLQATGLLWLLLTIRLRGRIAVLTYHRVLPIDADTCSTPGIIVTPSTFDRHMACLNRHFNVLTADEFVSLVAGNLPRPPRACLITFDDGWHDNYSHALPVLRAHRLPALLFVASRFPGTTACFWQERAARALKGLAGAGESGTRLLRELGFYRLAGSSPESRFSMICDAVVCLKKLPAPAREEQLSAVQIAAQLAGLDLSERGDDRFLAWNELREMADTGLVAIGSHAASHRPLPSLTEAETRAEIEESRATIRRELGIVPAIFAYPNGDASAETANLIKDAGFVAAFTTRRGLVADGDDRYRLPRINIHEGAASTEAELLCKIAGLF